MKLPSSQAKPLSRGERGVAMLVVLTWLALMIALVSEFTYGTTVDAAQAANARDELRAHYLARSSVNLSRLLDQDPAEVRRPVDGAGAADAAQSMGGAGKGASAAGARRRPRARAAWASACASPTTRAR